MADCAHRTRAGDGDQRVVQVGQWLGTQNSIVAMEWTRPLGWVAKDSTGEGYSQRKAPKSALLVHCPGGLHTFDVPTDGRTPTPRTPWPAPPTGAVP